MDNTADTLIERMALHEMTTRQGLLSKYLVDKGRNIDSEAGYPANPTYEHYRIMWEKEGVARRVVSIFPDESWASTPTVVEDEDPTATTAFEKAWETLIEEHAIFNFLNKADTVSGIGRYGIILVGMNDGRELSVPAGKATEITYLRCFPEPTIAAVDTDPKSRRYGLPVMYTVTLDVDAELATSLNIHWTRKVHLADNAESSLVYGTPRMKPVYNRCYDLRKIYAGSGEMFWKGGWPGLALETQDPNNVKGIDAVEAQRQMENYRNSLQPFLALKGLTVKSLPSSIADPDKHVEVHLRAIATSIGCPYRVFLGTEEGKLAGGQDSVKWNRILMHRQRTYCGPKILRPFIALLQSAGILPKATYGISWPDLNTQTEDQLATVALKKAQALTRYAGKQGARAIMAPEVFFNVVMGMSPEHIALAMANMPDPKEFEEEEEADDDDDGFDRTDASVSRERNGEGLDAAAQPL